MIYVIGKNGFVAKRINKYFKSKKKKLKFIGSRILDLTKIQKILIKHIQHIFLSAVTPDKVELSLFKNISMIVNFYLKFE